MNFIKTTDAETSDKLIKSGLRLLSQQNGVWTFLNNGKLQFSEEENKKIVFTNKLEL